MTIWIATFLNYNYILFALGVLAICSLVTNRLDENRWIARGIDQYGRKHKGCCVFKQPQHIFITFDGTKKTNGTI